jgi:hypothetical protein
MVRAGDAGALDILGQRQAQTMQALQFAAQGSEREIGREFQREMMERQAAQAALEGGLQNIAGGLGQVGSAAVLGLQGAKTGAVEAAPAMTMEEQASSDVLASLDKTQAARDRAGRKMIRLQDQLDEEQVPLLTPSTSRIANVLAPEEEFSLTERMFRLPSEMKEGGMVTGGKFDHKTNPIDIIQQGRKIGEMTGGEVILNPQQQKKLSKESAYFRQLLKKFNKQK